MGTSLFQPTLPARGATSSCRDYARLDLDFNPRSPHGERHLQPSPCPHPRHFNPRSPHGERQDTTFSGVCPTSFQPTLPARGAISPRKTCVPRHNFNPRSPHGERLQRFQHSTQSVCISTHAPRTGSDPAASRASQRPAISTHAPRTGSDAPRHGRRPTRTLFQPTLPARGATDVAKGRKRPRKDFNPRSPHGERRNSLEVAFQHGGISTHAPRTGSDCAK